MIDEIQFNQYRKLKDITFKFDPLVNLISGTNGTCKSTLMHIVGNSFQTLKRTDAHFTGSPAILTLNKFVDKVNPKIETVSRGDKSGYSNPAKGRAGTLFAVKYIDGKQLSFRRHNSEKPEGKRIFVSRLSHVTHLRQRIDCLPPQWFISGYRDSCRTGKSVIRLLPARRENSSLWASKPRSSSSSPQ